MEVKVKLRELMDKKGTTFTKINRATGITRPTLLNLADKEPTSIKLDNIKKLCDYFECTVSDLIYYPKDEEAIEEQKTLRRLHVLMEEQNDLLSRLIEKRPDCNQDE